MGTAFGEGAASVSPAPSEKSYLKIKYCVSAWYMKVQRDYATALLEVL